MYLVITMDDLREQLKNYMAEKDLTINEVAKIINRTSRTVFRFLHGQTIPRFQTEYKIKRLIKDK